MTPPRPPSDPDRFGAWELPFAANPDPVFVAPDPAVIEADSITVAGTVAETTLGTFPALTLTFGSSGTGAVTQVVLIGTEDTIKAAARLVAHGADAAVLGARREQRRRR